MSNFTSTIDLIQTAQAQKEVTANAFFDAASPATAYGRRGSTSAGLTWGYYGAVLNIAGVPNVVNNGVITLTASQSAIYIEANPSTGALTQNNTAFTPGRIPLYVVTTDSTTVTNYLDKRTFNKEGSFLHAHSLMLNFNKIFYFV